MIKYIIKCKDKTHAQSLTNFKTLVQHLFDTQIAVLTLRLVDSYKQHQLTCFSDQLEFLNK